MGLYCCSSPPVVGRCLSTLVVRAVCSFFASTSRLEFMYEVVRLPRPPGAGSEGGERAPGWPNPATQPNPPPPTPPPTPPPPPPTLPRRPQTRPLPDPHHRLTCPPPPIHPHLPLHHHHRHLTVASCLRALCVSVSNDVAVGTHLFLALRTRRCLLTSCSGLVHPFAPSPSNLRATTCRVKREISSILREINFASVKRTGNLSHEVCVQTGNLFG